VADEGARYGRPAAAVYDDRLFLFFRGGERYTVFDGTAWSDEILQLEGAAPNATPAAVAYNGKLDLFFKVGTRVVHREFDGTNWGALRGFPPATNYAPYEMAAGVRGNSLEFLYEEWGQLPRTELYAKVSPGVYPQDFDADGDVDLSDFRQFQICFNGSNTPPARTGCSSTDLDDDGDVDLADFDNFRACFGGPNRPPARL
jgi:hypothetical protein